MKFYNLKSYYLVTNISEHQKNKENLLKLIDETEQESYEDVSFTDWKISNESGKPYVKCFYDMITPYIKDMSSLMKFKKCEIYNIWFQIYHKNSKHDWHVHNGANWTNVYYLHLPENKLKTEIYDIKSNSIINNIEVKEGQLLTIPAGMLHRSPKNETDDRKVIISFNSDFSELALTI
jgi:cupin superfamily acireductone dioxygenase involved in methionine salvage